MTLTINKEKSMNIFLIIPKLSKYDAAILIVMTLMVIAFLIIQSWIDRNGPGSGKLTEE